jgi:hypothetical protein
MADAAAQLFGIAQGSFLAHKESSDALTALGDPSAAAERRTRAEAIRQEFEAAATAAGRAARTVGDKTFTPWQLPGVLLAIVAHDVSTTTTRLEVVNGRVASEFLMDE